MEKTSGSRTDPDLQRCNKIWFFVGRGGVPALRQSRMGHHADNKIGIDGCFAKKLTNGKNIVGVKNRHRPTKMRKYGFCRAWWGLHYADNKIGIDGFFAKNFMNGKNNVGVTLTAFTSLR